MKGLNKLALATAVAAAPFAAQAELTAMSDQAMGNTTGQAGVTIELNTSLSMDQVQYSQGSSTGSVLVNNLKVGGIGTDAGKGFGDGLDMEINVDLPDGTNDLGSGEYGSKAGTTLGGDQLNLNDGDALISIQNYNSPVDGQAVPVDMRLEMGADLGGSNTDGQDAAFQLSSSDGTNTATMISNLKADLFLTQLDIIARNDAVTDSAGNTVGSESTGAIEVEAGFAIDDLDADFDVASVSIQNMRVAGANSLEAEAPDGSGGTIAGSSVLKDTGQGTGNVLAAGAAVVSMDIGQGVALSGTGTAGGETLRVNLANFQADMWMPTINVGGGTNASIGSVAIDNLTVNNTQMAIYGRD